MPSPRFRGQGGALRTYSEHVGVQSANRRAGIVEDDSIMLEVGEYAVNVSEVDMFQPLGQSGMMLAKAA